MDFRAFSGEQALQKRDEYRRHAAECRDLARELGNEGARQELLDLADVWLSLANTRDTAAH